MGRRGDGTRYMEALKRFISDLRADQPRRLHLASDKIPKFFSKRQKIEHKPSGLWYGFDDSWMDWCFTEQSNWLQPLIYEILVEPSQVLTITNEEEFEAFEDEYWGIPEHMLKLQEERGVSIVRYPGMRTDNFGFPFLGGRMRFIDYPRLSQKYGALEITPYLCSKRLESIWYYGWDCESGCVWKRKAVKDLRLVAEYDNDSGEYKVLT